eukprot:6474982-Amphidinium_carterae.1
MTLCWRALTFQSYFFCCNGVQSCSLLSHLLLSVVQFPRKGLQEGGKAIGPKVRKRQAPHSQ